MKRFTLCIAALTAMTLVSPTWAGQDKAEPQLRLALDLVDGSHIIGVPSIESVPVQTSYAKMDVPLNQIISIKMGDDHETASVELQNGDKVKGVISLAPINLETVFGTVKIGTEHIRELRVVLAGGTLSGSWITPMGGNAVVKGGEVELSGPGDGQHGNAIAILDKATPSTCRITGELKRTGLSYGGFVIGYNSKDKTFLGAYAQVDTGTSTACLHRGTTRTILGNPIALVFPPVDRYAKFKIDISPKKVTFQIENSTLTMDIPAGVTGDCFGIETYHGSTMQIRNLVIDGE